VPRADLDCCLFEAFGIAPGEDNVGALGPGLPGGFQPDAGAAANEDDGLADQFRFAMAGHSTGCGGHDSYGRGRASTSAAFAASSELRYARDYLPDTIRVTSGAIPGARATRTVTVVLSS